MTILSSAPLPRTSVTVPSPNFRCITRSPARNTAAFAAYARAGDATNPFCTPGIFSAPRLPAAMPGAPKPISCFWGCLDGCAALRGAFPKGWRSAAAHSSAISRRGISRRKGDGALWVI